MWKYYSLPPSLPSILSSFLPFNPYERGNVHQPHNNISNMSVLLYYRITTLPYELQYHRFKSSHMSFKLPSFQSLYRSDRIIVWSAIIRVFKPVFILVFYKITLRLQYRGLLVIGRSIFAICSQNKQQPTCRSARIHPTANYTTCVQWICIIVRNPPVSNVIERFHSTLRDFGFVSIALYIPYPHRSFHWPKHCSVENLFSTRISQLTAYHVTHEYVYAITIYGTPDTEMEDLDCAGSRKTGSH